jgi:hypothetical protein
LLSLFTKYAPDFVPQLQAQLAAVAPDAPENFRNGTSNLLTAGLTNENKSKEETQGAMDQAEHTRDPDERDSIYAMAALSAAASGDMTARDLTDKIGNSDVRKSARAFVDVTLTSKAIGKKSVEEALKLTRGGELTNYQRAWFLVQIAGLLKKTDSPPPEEILEEAATEARRISGSDPDRTRVLVGIARKTYDIDHTHVWEAATEAMKAANVTPGFTGEDAHIQTRFISKHGASATSNSEDTFDLNGIVGLLAKDDLYRAIDLAKGFNGEAARATATIAVARSVLTEKPKR